MRKIYCLLMIILLLTSCSVKKTEKTQEENKNKKTIDQEVMKPQKPFETFSCKVSGNYKGIPIVASVRISYDSVVWLSASSMGIEGVRVLCFMDSIFVINKLQKEYIATTYNKIFKYIGVPLSYNFVQSIFFDTLQTQTFNSPNFTGTIKKEIVKVNDSIYLPNSIEIEAIFNQQKQNIKLKIKNHQINPQNTYPFTQPNNYKIRN